MKLPSLIYGTNLQKKQRIEGRFNSNSTAVLSNAAVSFKK